MIKISVEICQNGRVISVITKYGKNCFFFFYIQHVCTFTRIPLCVRAEICIQPQICIYTAFFICVYMYTMHIHIIYIWYESMCENEAKIVFILYCKHMQGNNVINNSDRYIIKFNEIKYLRTNRIIKLSIWNFITEKMSGN